jgi:sulfur-oxidizing protein SoxY
MTADDHVKAIHIFAERNPRPTRGDLSPRPEAGRADVTTRVRLGGTQN